MFTEGIKISKIKHIYMYPQSKIYTEDILDEYSSNPREQEEACPVDDVCD